MRGLIMNERMVELAFEGKRNEDLRRTRRMHKLTGTIEQMVQGQFLDAPATKLRDSLENPFGVNTLGLDPTLCIRDTLNWSNTTSLKKFFEDAAKLQNINQKAIAKRIEAADMIYFKTPEGKYGIIYIVGEQTDSDEQVYLSIIIKRQPWLRLVSCF